jgi:dihydrofolate reductase
MIRAVVAYDQNRAIGGHNELLWGPGDMKDDMRRFRETTRGHTVIMGRKTYDSIGRPLPDRRNIVVSRTVSDIPGAESAQSIEAALQLAEHDDNIDIIGGQQIYALALPYLDAVVATEVQNSFDGADAHFPELPGDWNITEDTFHESDSDNKYPYRFVTYERQK